MAASKSRLGKNKGSGGREQGSEAEDELTASHNVEQDPLEIAKGLLSQVCLARCKSGTYYHSTL